MGELSQATFSFRSEMMGLNEVPVDKIEEELTKLQDRYRVIFADIATRYVKPQEYTNINGKPRD